MAQGNSEPVLAADLINEAFHEAFKEPRDDSVLVSGEVPIETPQIRPIRFKTVDLMLAAAALTTVYRERTPKTRELRGSAAIRLPEDSNTLRVLPLSEQPQDFVMFARGQIEGYKMTPDDKRFWESVLREVQRVFQVDKR
jgi:hypothetical protein